MNGNVTAITCMYDMIWYENFKYLSKLIDWKIIKKNNLPQLVRSDSAIGIWRQCIHVSTLRKVILQKPLKTTDTCAGPTAHLELPRKWVYPKQLKIHFKLTVK